MDYEQSLNPHSYVYVLKDEIRFALKVESKGFFKKTLKTIPYVNTIELINDGIKKHGNRYIATCDLFYFDKPDPVQILSKTSYDELVAIHRWRYEHHPEHPDYDYSVLYGNSIEKYSALRKKYAHISSELSTFYAPSNDPQDPDYEVEKNHKMQMGPKRSQPILKL